MSRIKALLFDVFGTVVDWRSCISAEIEQIARNHDIDFDAARLLMSGGHNISHQWNR